MSIDYASEKMSAAIAGMAASPARLQDRLRSAHITFHAISAERDLPTQQLRDQYAEIMQRLTADKSDEREGYVPTTTSRMTDTEAEAVARLIVNFADAIEAERR